MSLTVSPRPRTHGRAVKQLIPRLAVLISLTGFIATYLWMYEMWLHPAFGYFGFAYHELSKGLLILLYTLSLIPALWMPLSLTRPSQLIYWVLYLTVFIPSMFVPIFVLAQPVEDIVRLIIILFVGFLITGLCYKLPLLRVKPPAIPKVLFWWSFAGAYIFLTAWVSLTYWGNFRFVSFSDVYEEVRFSGGALATGYVNYAIMWLAGAFNPFLIAWGIFHRRPAFFLLGGLGEFILYGTTGMKSTVVAIVMIPLLFFVIRTKDRFGLILTGAVVATFAGLNLLIALSDFEITGSLLILAGLVFMRMFGMPGLATALYYDFFSQNELTYFSHLNIAKGFIKFPYEYSIGEEIGVTYYSEPLLNLNAHFWCTDGLAALGLGGIIVASILGGAVLWIIDSATAERDPVMSALAVSFAALNLANTSVFTTLLSGGLFFSLIFLFTMPSRGASAKRTWKNRVVAPSSSQADGAYAPATVRS